MSLGNDKVDILVISEGASREKKLIKTIFRIYNLDSYKFYSYKTNIHVLFQALEGYFTEGENNDIDFLSMLRERETNSAERDILSKAYSDIILIFDLDPQDLKYDAKKIEKMQEFFSESTENGKLYINYPMVESIRHFKHEFPDNDYKDLKVLKSELRNYKRTVSSQSILPNIGNFDRDIVKEIIEHNLKKVRYLLEGNYILDKYVYTIDESLRIISLQDSCLKGSNGYCYVLNTCLFYLLDYNSELIISD